MGCCVACVMLVGVHLQGWVAGQLWDWVLVRRRRGLALNCFNH